MCLPTKTDQSPSSRAGTGTGSLLGIGGLMLLACVGGPVLAGALGAFFALAICLVVPALVMAWREASARLRPRPKQ